jgi:hypothetical protein
MDRMNRISRLVVGLLAAAADPDPDSDRGTETETETENRTQIAVDQSNDRYDWRDAVPGVRHSTTHDGWGRLA